MALCCGAGSVRLVSTDCFPPAATGGAGSWGSILSRNGRYVLFASLANNLVVSTNASAIPGHVPPAVNIFLRDRATGTTTLVSPQLGGQGGANGHCIPEGISDDGRYALFESSASDLVDADTNATSDIFLRDLAAGTTSLVSRNTNGAAGNGFSRSAIMTPDGRYVAFVSAADDLVPGDTNRISDVFVRDLPAGTTTLVSVGAQFGLLPEMTDSLQITPDGRFVGFFSTASNLVPGVPRSGELYVRDLQAANTIWASAGARAIAAAAGLGTSVICYNFVLSDDGQYVAYETSSWANRNRGLILRYNLGTGITDLIETNAPAGFVSYEEFRSLDMTPDGRFVAYVANTNSADGGTTCVYVWDAQSRIAELASADLSGAVPTNSTCHAPSLDVPGRYVVFLSSASGLTTNFLAGEYHLYRRDLQNGTTALVDADPAGNGTLIDPATAPQLSADGNLVSFECPDSLLVPNDQNRDFDVFVKDFANGATEFVSARDVDWPSITPNGGSHLAAGAASSDGRYVVFVSEAENLSGTDTNRCLDVFWRDLLEETNVLISSNTNGCSADASSAEPAISPDGMYVAFSSRADDLVIGDPNRTQDVFLRNVSAGTIVLVSLNRNGTGPGNKASYGPIFGVGGRFVLFRSLASDLAAGSFSGGENLFVRDLQASTNYALTHAGVIFADLAPAGRYVTFTPKNSASSYLWDLLAASTIYTNIGLSAPSFASPDGTRILCWLNSQLWSVDRVANATQIVASGLAPNPNPTARFSADGTCLVYHAHLSGQSWTNQVYLYNFVTRTNLLVSHRYGSTEGANGHSDSPWVSPDGRFVVYRSAATDLVPGSTTGVQLYVYDVQADSQALLTSAFVSGPANGPSLLPMFSADGSTLFFQSWASDLALGDFNAQSDLFASSFLSVTISPGAPGHGPWLSWPYVRGRSYHAQYKDSLAEPVWENMGGTMTNAGVKAWQQDPTPSATHRFYRIEEF